MSTKPHWPPRWSQKGKSIYYVTRKDDKHLYGGKTWYRLGATEAEAFEHWYRIHGGSNAIPRTIGEAMDMYAASDKFKRLAENTKGEYRRILGGNLRKVFGHMNPPDLYPVHVYGYLERRPPAAGNREISVLSNVMKLCVRKGAVKMNPINRDQIERNQESPRDRYVTDSELADFLAIASPLIRAWVGLKRVTGMRQVQLRNARLEHWTPGYWKTVGEVREWVPGILKVPGKKRGRENNYSGGGLDDAMAYVLGVRPEIVGPDWLFMTRTGNQYTAGGLRSIFFRYMRKYVTDGGLHFTEHDVRAKAGSDAANPEETQALLGHQSLQMANRVYRRKPNNVRALK